MSKSGAETRTCRTCGHEKPLALFPKWRAQCKACKSAENGARLKERYATDPTFAERTKERAAAWQQENAERSNAYHRRRHAAKMAAGDERYESTMSAAQRRYRGSEKGKAAIAARMQQYEENGQAKAWRAARFAKPESRASAILHGARNRALKMNVEFNLIFDDVYPAVAAGVCPRTGVVFDLSPHPDLRRNPRAPSIDRIDSAKGYVRGNVQIVCNWYNLAKHELPEAEMLDFCRRVVDNATKPDV